jgi:hypothetical protein
MGKNIWRTRTNTEDVKGSDSESEEELSGSATTEVDLERTARGIIVFKCLHVKQVCLCTIHLWHRLHVQQMGKRERIFHLDVSTCQVKY